MPEGFDTGVKVTSSPRRGRGSLSGKTKTSGCSPPGLGKGTTPFRDRQGRRDLWRNLRRKPCTEELVGTSPRGESDGPWFVGEGNTCSRYFSSGSRRNKIYTTKKITSVFTINEKSLGISYVLRHWLSKEFCGPEEFPDLLCSM